MPETRRTRQRGWGLVPLGIAALTAATGAALYWYFSRDQRVPETSRRRTIPTKKKSVVIVLSQGLIERIPLYEVSTQYADVYLICPPTVQDVLDNELELATKVEHSTRVLSCATEQGVVHIARHIGADVVLLDHEYLWAVEQVKGWTGRVICVETKGCEIQIQDNVVRTSWPETMALEELLSIGSQ